MEASAQSDQQPGSGNNKRKRRPAGTPDPDAEVVSLSPKTLMESDRYICEICNQGFQRDQNLQMHRRRHKVPWKLLKRAIPEVRKRVYVCPEPSCLHHDPCHALGDLVGIKKHYRRKHSTEKHWKCSKCSKGYAVQSDYKAHLKTCGTRGHSCACGRVFSRVESFIEHQDACSVAREKATETDASSGLHFLRLGIAMPQNSRNASIVFPNQLNRYISDPSVYSGWSVEQQQGVQSRELQLMPMIRMDARKSSLVRVDKGAREEVSYRSTSNGIEELQLSIGLPLNGVDYTDTTTTDLRLSSEGDVYSGAKLENHEHVAMLRYIQECRLLQTNDRDTERFYSTLGEEEPETELSLGRGGCVSRFRNKKQRISGECYTVSISDSRHVCSPLSDT